MKLTVCVAILAACLAGCVSPEAKRDAEARAQTVRALEACKAQTFKTHVERAKCINDGLGLSRTTLANPDLLDLISATRIALAATVDRRELTEEDATVQLARAQADANSEDQRRTNSNLSVAAQQQQADAASAARLPVTCSKLGNSVTCF
jgi:hypothetical protein